MKLTTLSVSFLVVCLAGCSSSESTPPNTPASGNDSGTTTTTTNDSGTTTTPTGDDSGTTTTGDDAGDDSGTTTAADCTDKGTAVAAPWTFAVSATSMNSGKGQVLSVNRCDTVTWTNTDTASHSVVSTGPAGGFTFSTNTAGGPSTALTPVQFTKAGTYTYDCGIHGKTMIGQITVAP